MGYTKQLDEFWPTIMLAWKEHGDKNPIIECDVVKKKVFAWPAKEYINSLSERTREATQVKFKEITDKGGMMVFIRDSKNKILQSQTFIPKRS